MDCTTTLNPRCCLKLRPIVGMLFKANRVDLRHLPLVTVDPADAKDYDDAVLVEPLADGYRLWVAIADVSAFVPSDSAIELEACLRGCSTYLPDSVVPMLPAGLSEDKCSLVPDVDRAAIVLELTLDQAALVRSAKVYRALIRSVARLSYQQVQRVLDRAGNGQNDLEQRLMLMNRCAEQISKCLRSRGQLFFDLPESTIALDEEGWPKTIRPTPIGSANRMVESFMITANEAVARFLNRVEAACLYRIHPPPDGDRIEEFIQFAKGLGVIVPFATEPSALQIARFLESVHGHEKAVALEQLLLRSLMQARYSSSCKEHFGLASSCYLHFTSPIRRYPDLVVHRQLSRVLSAYPDGVSFEAPLRIRDWPINPEQAMHIADLCTRAERRSLACERQAQSLYHAAYMSQRVGQSYLGRVVMLAEFGLFVRLEPIGVEGLIHVANMLDDHYVLDPVDLVLVGRRTNKRYCIGDLLRVQVQDAKLDAKQIDLTILSDEPKGE